MYFEKIEQNDKISSNALTNNPSEQFVETASEWQDVLHTAHQDSQLHDASGQPGMRSQTTEPDEPQQAETTGPLHQPSGTDQAEPEESLIEEPPPQSSSNKDMFEMTKGRIIAVSNRVIDPDKPAAGGVAIALSEALHDEDSLWFGWSGKVSDTEIRATTQRSFGKTLLAQIDLSHDEYQNYYSGYFNSFLWPILHDSAKWASFKHEYYDAYITVNKVFAEHIAPMLQSNDLLWINDCHLIPLARELRALGCQQKIGFFNHTPFPETNTFKLIPQHKDLAQAFLSYDLLGMQIPRDIEHFKSYVDSEKLGDFKGDTLRFSSGSLKIKDFPIGIDVNSLRSILPDDASRPLLSGIDHESQKRVVMIGVERLDYTKGIPRKIKAFNDLLEKRPELHGKVTLFQIAAPSRETVPAYQQLINKTNRLVEHVNNRYGNDDWKPVIYLNYSVDRRALPNLYALSKVGIVNSVADGMNLVAKEYVAAQKADNPGTLILSEGAGASAQLRDALLIPPKNRAALTEAYEKALSLPLEERISRHTRLMDNIENENLKNWYDHYLMTLRSL